MRYKQSLLIILFLLCYKLVLAQPFSLDPELNRMILNANEIAARGDFSSAITIYNNALKIEPANSHVIYFLGKSYYASGDYKNAVKFLKSAARTQKKNADVYCLLAELQLAQLHKNKAKKTLKLGLKMNPKSGVLFNKLGRIYELQNKHLIALLNWKLGILAEANFPENYFDYSKLSIQKKLFPDGLFCAEIYICIESSDSNKIYEMKNILWNGYKSMMNAFGNCKSYSDNKLIRKNINILLESSKIFNDFEKLSPVLGDGVTTDNLTVLRTRLLIDRFQFNNDKEFTFLKYQLMMLKSGWFEIYNEWLFGKVEDDLQYTSWNTFHSGAIDSFLLFKNSNKYLPLVKNGYLH